MFKVSGITASGPSEFSKGPDGPLTLWRDLILGALYLSFQNKNFGNFYRTQLFVVGIFFDTTNKPFCVVGKYLQLRKRFYL